MYTTILLLGMASSVLRCVGSTMHSILLGHPVVVLLSYSIAGVMLVGVIQDTDSNSTSVPPAGIHMAIR